MQPEPLLNHVQLVEQVRAAFPLDPIKVDGAFSDWGITYSDVESYEDHIDGKTWEELDRKYMVTREDALGFLGTKYLIAVLPVYLRSLIEEGVWSAAAWTMIIILTKPEPDRKTGIKLSRFQAFVDSLTPAQRTVIAEVLKAFATADQDGSPGIAAKAALDSHWRIYLQDGS
jgi:hypothetical protein